jgi:hypothetical protein
MHVLTVSCGSTKTFPGLEEGIDFAIRKVLQQFLVSQHKSFSELFSRYQLLHLLT